MCDRRELVPIPAFLWGDIYDFDPTHPEYGIDAEGRACLSLDACIVPAVVLLWEHGFRTFGCCCGHGNGEGVISVRTLPTESGMADLRERIRQAPDVTQAPTYPRRAWVAADERELLSRPEPEGGRGEKET